MRSQTAPRFADLSLDPRQRLAFRAGRPLALSPLEYRLLETFLLHPLEALSREALARQVWGRPLADGSNFVDVGVMGLRRQLEAGGQARLIQTVRGYGYALRV